MPTRDQVEAEAQAIYTDYTRACHTRAFLAYRDLFEDDKVPWRAAAEGALARMAESTSPPPPPPPP